MHKNIHKYLCILPVDYTQINVYNVITRSSKTDLENNKIKSYKEVVIMCMTKSELEKKVQELRSLKAMKEELENEVKEAERQIIEYMTEHEIDTEITDTAKITYKPQSRTTLDKDKLTEILGEDLKPFEKVTSYNVLRIK